ncbi:MAG: ATP-binding cassette domain-containing protein [Candidatus Aenigmatarchaeota archaeon]
MPFEKYAIKVENLTKKFNEFIAVDSITFNVHEGEIFGLLGPNGAGKTTTINMLSTLLNITSGYAEVAGFDVSKQKNEVRKSIGIVFQEPALDNKLTGRENLEFHAMMYGMESNELKKRVSEVLSIVELEEKADLLVEKYSGGMKRRLEIARGLVHRPKILFLDEPTLGLDAQTRRHIWEYIKNLNKKYGVTIILTTHYMEEADYLCDRVAIIDHGKIIAIDKPNKLKDILGGDVISLEIEGDTEKYKKYLSSLKWIKSIKIQEKRIHLTTSKGEEKIPRLVCSAPKFGINIKSVTLHKPSLEDVFIYFTGRNIREEANGNSFRKEMMKRRHGF